jgi:hypothetical protein
VVSLVERAQRDVAVAKKSPERSSKQGRLTAMAKYSGECFCGAVQVEASGEPEAMGYCHCRSCRSWSGGPINAFSLWKPDAVKITSGAEHVGMFQKTPVSQCNTARSAGVIY